MLTGLLNRGCNRKVNSPFGNEGYTLTSEGQTEVNIYGFGYGYKKITWKREVRSRPDILDYYLYEYINLSRENVK